MYIVYIYSIILSYILIELHLNFIFRFILFEEVKYIEKMKLIKNYFVYS